MDKYEAISESFTLCNMAFRKLMDLKDKLRGELKTLLVVNAAHDIDDIKDLEAYKRAVEIEYQMEKVGSQAEALSGWIDDLIKIKL